jgi:hypothetical protein
MGKLQLPARRALWDVDQFFTLERDPRLVQSTASRLEPKLEQVG